MFALLEGVGGRARRRDWSARLASLARSTQKNVRVENITCMLLSLWISILLLEYSKCSKGIHAIMSEADTSSVLVAVAAAAVLVLAWPLASSA